MKIGVIGNGFVGKATSLFSTDFVKVFVYDKDPDKCDPYGTTVADLYGCDFVFICVPTPMRKDGSCHTQIVEKCVYELNIAGIKDHSIVVRSTVPVGFCKSLGVNFMPEFLTEANWEKDFENNNAWTFGLHDIELTPVKCKFAELITSSKAAGKIQYDDIFFCSSEEAELSKLTRNSFLATKVSFFNEIHEFCEKKGLNFNTVASLIALDNRIGESHTQVPGPDGKMGFGGTCFPKDLSSLHDQMLQCGMKSYIVSAAESRNDKVDRVEQDWSLDKGRSVI